MHTELVIKIEEIKYKRVILDWLDLTGYVDRYLVIYRGYSCKFLYRQSEFSSVSLVTILTIGHCYAHIIHLSV